MYSASFSEGPLSGVPLHTDPRISVYMSGTFIHIPAYIGICQCKRLSEEK